MFIKYGAKCRASYPSSHLVIFLYGYVCLEEIVERYIRVCVYIYMKCDKNNVVTVNAAAMSHLMQSQGPLIQDATRQTLVTVCASSHLFNAVSGS